MTVVSLDMAYCSFREVLAGLDTRLDMPPSIDSHHPDSDLAPASAPVLMDAKPAAGHRRRGDSSTKSYPALLPRNHLERRHPGHRRVLDALALRAGQHLGSGQPAAIGGAPQRNRHLPPVDAGANAVAVAERQRARH